MELINVSASDYNKGNSDYVFTIKSYSKLKVLGVHTHIIPESIKFEDIPKHKNHISC